MRSEQSHLSHTNERLGGGVEPAGDVSLTSLRPRECPRALASHTFIGSAFLSFAQGY